ncbi:hypothetical protein BD779DRAFT_1471475 [Infundibulicybe gibba]|nr:hypothetical protein BD779DRAFT_1471475 [Infundibulicybe gibba]
MARPRKYRTPEECKAANRAKNKRHYQKNKSEISAQRRNIYQTRRLKSNTGTSEKSPPQDSTSPTHPHLEVNNRTPEGLGYWCCRTKTVYARFKRLVHEDTRQYCNQIYDLYKIKHNKDIINDAIICISWFQTSMRRYHAEVLQLAGVGEESLRVSECAKSIDDLVHWLEEILCAAMVNGDELYRLHAQRQLAYQM